MTNVEASNMKAAMLSGQIIDMLGDADCDMVEAVLAMARACAVVISATAIPGREAEHVADVIGAIRTQLGLLQGVQTNH